MLAMDTSLKSKREQFIAGHAGGSFFEVIVLGLIAQLSHVLFTSFLFAFPLLLGESGRIALLRHCLDFLLVYSPFLLSVTLLSDYTYLVFALLILLILLNFATFVRRQKKSLVGGNWRDLPLVYDGTRLPYVSSFMAALLLSTSVAILAVDLPVFDRRFAKTELYGWSLMDTGVGCFIAINGALSPESRFKSAPFASRIGKCLRSTIPLWLLGFARLAAVKSLNYQEHLTEYGAHWNFFFTIAFTKIFSSLLCALCDWRNRDTNYFYVAASIAALHQLSLCLGLGRFIQNQDRSTLVAANKEGLISTPGSVALYLAFVQFGRLYLHKRKTVGEFAALIRDILARLAASTLLMYGATWVERVSRREANLAYTLFLVSFALANIATELSFFLLLQLLAALDPRCLSPQYHSRLFASVSGTGLLVFLAANLLTGLANLALDPLSMPPSASMAALYLYSLCLSSVCLALHRYSIRV